MIWILIVINSLAYNGKLVSFQEFNTQYACEEARRLIIIQTTTFSDQSKNVICLPKGAP